MKKIAIIGILVVMIAAGLSGCLDEFRNLPSDEECRQKISAYLNKHSNFYDSSDTIYLSEWDGIGCKTRRFDWCHTQFPENPDITGTYCGAGSINCKGEIFYDGD